MTEIDYERLKLIVAGDIHESVRDQFDIDEIVSNAVLKKNGTVIEVTSSAFRLRYNAETYQQTSGCAGM